MKKNRSMVFMILAGVSWSFSGVLGKFCQWEALSLSGWRSLIAIVLLGLTRHSFRPVNTKWNWIGALGVALTSILFMMANKLTTSANAIVLQYAMTAIVILYQLIVLHRKPRRIDVYAALAVMLGVILCFGQNFGGGKFVGDLLALVSAVTWAVVFLAAKMPGVDALTYSYQGNLICTLLCIHIFFDTNIGPAGVLGWVVATSMGVCNVLGYLFFSLSMRGAINPTPAAIVANIEPVLNPLWVFLFLGEEPGLLTILGTIVVLCTVTLYSLRERKGEH